MAKREKKSPAADKKRGGFLARTARKLTAKLSARKRSAAAAETTQTAPTATASRPTKRGADVPLDLIAQTYTPPQTSLKTSFRSDGSDRQQHLASFIDERWEDEDHYTNKSGDARIGTHGRSYEPGEPAGSVENRR